MRSATGRCGATRPARAPSGPTGRGSRRCRAPRPVPVVGASRRRRRPAPGAPSARTPPCSRATSSTARLDPATAQARCSRRRAVSRARGGIAAAVRVNDPRRHAPCRLRRRRMRHHSCTRRPEAGRSPDPYQRPVLHPHPQRGHQPVVRLVSITTRSPRRRRARYLRPVKESRPNSNHVVLFMPPVASPAGLPQNSQHAQATSLSTPRHPAQSRRAGYPTAWVTRSGSGGEPWSVGTGHGRCLVASRVAAAVYGCPCPRCVEAMRAERDDTHPADGRQPREVERWRSNLGHRSALIALPKCVTGTWPGQRQAQARRSVRPYHALFVKVSEGSTRSTRAVLMAGTCVPCPGRW